jgi:hypothetical protein
MNNFNFGLSTDKSNKIGYKSPFLLLQFELAQALDELSTKLLYFCKSIVYRE